MTGKFANQRFQSVIVALQDYLPSRAGGGLAKSIRCHIRRRGRYGRGAELTENRVGRLVGAWDPSEFIVAVSRVRALEAHLAAAAGRCIS